MCLKGHIFVTESDIDNVSSRYGGRVIIEGNDIGLVASLLRYGWRSNSRNQTVGHIEHGRNSGYNIRNDSDEALNNKRAAGK